MKRDWLPLPHPEHMLFVCGLDSIADVIAEIFKQTGQTMLNELKAGEAMRPGDRVLEAGCGCGRFARMLIDEPITSYQGFDRFQDMVDWCSEEIAKRDERFRFAFFDEKVSEENAATWRWPFEDDSFDFAFLNSIFTNLSLEEAAAWLRELARVLAPGGRAVFSVFFAVGRSYVEGNNVNYYEPKAFWRVVEEAGFDHELQGPAATGRVHNWLALTPKVADEPA